MKYIASLTCLLLISVAAPAFALQGSECSAKSAKFKPAEREKFMQSCLAQARDPANVKEEERKQKSAQCEQNARNKKLQGSDKANYQASCMNKNEAATIASAQPKSAQSQKSASNGTHKSAPHKTSKKQKDSKVAKKSVNQSAKPALGSEGL